MEQKFILWINEVDKEDIPLVGGKGANLGELTKISIPVPPAFIVTAAAYYYFLEVCGLRPKIKNILTTLNRNDTVSLEQVSADIRKIIIASPIPPDISTLIIKSYSELSGPFRDSLVAIRSSATAEDLPNASFAGQQETFLNIKGEATVIEKVRRCWASLWLPRAIFYREENNFDHFKVGIAVPVQKMIQSETSGIMFSIDPLTNNKDVIVIEAIYGLGELIVQGAIIPDYYEVEKKTLKIINKEIAVQDKMLIKRGLGNELSEVKKLKRDKQKISDEQIIRLAKYAKTIENHYYFPQDIEWALEKNKIYLVQTRPVTTIKDKPSIQQNVGHGTWNIEHKSKSFLVGVGASPGIASGPVKLIHSAKEINKVLSGDILVTEMTNPDFVPAMRKTVGIVTDEGGRTAHSAIVSRELGIPCIVGAQRATRVFKTGDVITINGMTGEIFRGGKLKNNYLLTEKNNQISQLMSFNDNLTLKTATKLYVNLAEPERAKEIAQLATDGIGLLRAEFMMAQIGIHPKKILKDKKQESYIENLSNNIAIFCEAFNPRPVIYRTSDFKTNEYKNLIGGKDFEPEEPNPMLGYRGGFRYLSDPKVFEMELKAVKRVRNIKGFKNLWIMLPFIHKPKELIDIKKIMSGVGLMRSPTFKIWMMVEIPSNVILLDQFIKAGIDGISIGSNDLTMLILGVDRDNSEVAQIYNEEDDSVLWALEKIIKTCQKYKITSSLCGQAASDYPDLITKLVEWGISSISVNADAISNTRQIMYQAEKRLAFKNE